MLVTEKEILRVIHSHRESEFELGIYNSEVEQGLSKTATIKNRTTLPAQSLTAQTVNEKGEVLAQWGIDQIVGQMWESLSCFKMDGKMICKRSAYQEPMISKDDDLFLQSPIEQLIEDDVIGTKTGREVVLPDLSESDATSIMKGLADMRRSGGE